LTPLSVIVPVKSARRKSRLSGLLTEHEREEFARLLLVDVLQALRRAHLLSSCQVVSPDREMLKVAEDEGSLTLKESRDMGVNAAVAAGLRTARRNSDVLVIPSDLPLLKPSTLKHLLEIRSQGVDVVIAPSLAFDGTNALLFNSSRRFPLSYDDNSFWNHLAGASGRGLSAAVCTDWKLAFDVDSPDDFRALAGSRSGGRASEFARRVLR
jgi:2-phospho-L-lactate/phosphoenolpyruvate guanylyltransferase